MTRGRTRGPTGLLGSARGGRIRRDRKGEGCEGREHRTGVPRDATAFVMRPPASTDAGRGARADPGRALSPTASVMKATWMKSESQLSTYMNHMVPPPRPPPDRRDGPARFGSGDTEPPPPSPRPRPADGGTAVRRRREEPGRSAAPGRIRTSASRRRGGPAGRGLVPHPAGGAPATRGCTQWRAGDAARGGRTVPGGGDAAPAGGTAFGALPGRSRAGVEGSGAREARPTAPQQAPARGARAGRPPGLSCHRC